MPVMMSRRTALVSEIFYRAHARAQAGTLLIQQLVTTKTKTRKWSGGGQHEEGGHLKPSTQACGWVAEVMLAARKWTVVEDRFV
jgi:hypothetical protein